MNRYDTKLQTIFKYNCNKNYEINSYPELLIQGTMNFYKSKKVHV